MLTEKFLDLSFYILFSQKVDSEIKVTKDFYRDLIEVIESSKKSMKNDIPVSIANKVDCLLAVTKMKFDGKTNETIIDSLSVGEKFKSLLDFIYVKMDETSNDNEYLDLVNQVRLRKKLETLLKNYKELDTFISEFKDGNFESLDKIIVDYEELIRNSYLNVVESNKGSYIAATSSLDISKDNFDAVLKMIVKKYERKNVTPTGFPILDGEILNGGFEPSRLYIFAGGSGSGKSTLLNNFIVNAATIPQLNFNINQDSKDVPRKNVYIYVTLENTIEESLLRTYQPLFQKTTAQVIHEINSGVDIRNKITSTFDRTNSTLIMKYYRSMSIGCTDLAVLLDEVIDEYGRGSIRGLYVDYLDLLRSDIKNDLYRLELGFIALMLKDLAVQYNIPVITGSQLNRAAYQVKNSKELNLDQMSESVKKIEHSDFIGLLQNDKNSRDIVHFNCAKNRSGKSQVNIDFKVNFSWYKFLHGMIVTNKKKADIITDNLFGFEGVDSI